MSCWVVPLIAADYLNTSVEEVMRRIKNGSIPVRYDDGFTFVDVLPHVNGQPAASAMTYVPADESALAPAVGSDNRTEDDATADAPDVLFSWKDARRHAARQRQRPVAA